MREERYEVTNERNEERRPGKRMSKAKKEGNEGDK